MRKPARPSIVPRFLSRGALLLALLFGVSCAERGPTAPERPQFEVAGGASAGASMRPAVIISQVYGGGGNSNATLTHDYVELFNPADTAVDIGGWRLHYASSSGTSWSNTVTFAAGAVIQPGGYFLVQLASNNVNVGGAMPAPDATGGINMAAGAGKIVLTSTADGLPGVACPDPGSLVDRVGFGSTNCASWTATPTLSATLAGIRADDGCAYGTPADFGTGTPAPRNSSSPTRDCGGAGDTEVATVTVAPSAASIAVGATQALTATAFNAGSQPVAATFAWSSSNAAVATVDAAGVVTGAGEGEANITASAPNGVSGSATITVSAVVAPTVDVVISQVYGGGGNANATLTHDYVELFNRGSTQVDVSGWVVHYTSTSGTTWNNTAEIPAGSVIPAGGYFLVQLASQNPTVGGAMPPPDATGSINMAAGAGKVVLTVGGVSLSGACPTGAGIVDRVNFGSANCAADWGQTGTLSSTLAAFRSGGGCVQTGNNTPDFTTALPAPRNSGSLRNVCAGPTTAAVTPSSATVQAGGTVAFTATGLTADGQQTAAAFTWSSSNTAVATVHPATGTATGVSAGTATITAMAQNGVTASAALEVTVPPPATGLVITEFLSNPEGDDTLGEWFEIFNAGTAAVDLQGWHLKSNSSSGVEEHTIATSVVVPAGGFVVLGNNADVNTNGGVTIAYSYGGDIILNNSNTDWLTLKRPDGTLEDSVSYSTRDATGTIISPQFTPINATSRALINVDLDNSVAATGNWVSSTMAYGDGRNLGSPGWGPYGVAGPVASVVVAPPSAAVLVGGTTTFTSLALDALGKVSTAPLAWSSANPAIASIDATTGVVTGHAEGIVSITATAASGVSGSATVAVVTPSSPATLTVGISDPGYFVAGIERRLFATIRNWENATISPTPPVTWTVTPSHLARVNTYIGSDGFARSYVEALAPGTVEVRGTAENGVFGVRSVTIQPADAPTSAVYRNHVEFGMPTPGDSPDDIIVAKRGFVSSWNQTRGGPNWVSWNLNATHFGGVSRCDCFSPDRDLPPGTMQVFDSEYINSGYDRGHMVQSESRTTTLQENAATFLFTNILPQAAANNQVSWLAFENHLNNLARQQGREVYVIAGGEYAANPQTINNAGRIQIPDWTWKIAVVMEAGKGLADVQDLSSLEVIAVRMPNLVSTAVGTSNWQQFTTTVNTIEAATGFDFLAELPDWIERIVESGTRPPVAVAGGPYAGVEGSAVAFDATQSSDPDEGDVLSFAWSFGDGASGTGSMPTHTYADNGTYTVRLIVSDQFGAADTTYTTAVITNAAPTLLSLVTPPAAAIGTPQTVSVSWTDPGVLDTHTVTFHWGDGTSTTVAGSGGTASATHSYGAAGFYTVQVVVTDNDGAAASGSADVPVAVYDPNGSVNGGGTFMVAAGALVLQPDASGRANIAFNARSTRGRLTGNLEMHLNSADFRFTADALDWLVVEGERATLRGSGRLRGSTGTYTFTLVVQDGRGPNPGRARLIIRDAAGLLVFDNLPGAPEAATAALTGNVTVRQ